MIRMLGIAIGWLALAAPSAPTAATAPAANPDPWQALLDKYLDTVAADGVNRFRYAAVTAEDRRTLATHLQARQAMPVSTLPEKSRLAFWINLYNAQTVAVVLAAWPVKSILDINPSGRPEGKGKGPWKHKSLTVEGRALSLDDIENAILRPEFRDPRIHFALNCASLGCPELSPEAYAPEKVDRQLERAARAFLASPHAVRAEGPALVLSSIFDWYRVDFGKTERAVRERLAGWAPVATASLLRGTVVKVEYRYDWSVNAAP